jgi:peptidoglycan/xylan/chitin deacetylase (PgdA/CDA1 family)
MNMTYPISETQKAVFTLSIDFELMWGTADRPYAADFRSLCETERREVIDRLLGLLQEYGISATWGVVGHLFLREGEKDCLPPAGVPNGPADLYPNGPADFFTNGAADLFTNGPADLYPNGPADLYTNGPANLYYGADLLERIRRCKVKQEIGSHTFSHIEMDESKCSRPAAEREVEACVRVAGKSGVEMKSFIFPRNLVGHLDVLKRHGFTCYRGPEPHWYRTKRRMIRRMGHLFEIAALRTPPSVVPKEEDGIWNIPGSMLYTPSFGARRFLPVWMRVLRAKRGLDNAVRRNEIFHLWFHPTDLACRMDAMMDGLRRIFEHVANLRESGRLVVRPMGDLVPARDLEACEREAMFVA